MMKTLRFLLSYGWFSDTNILKIISCVAVFFFFF